MIKLRILRGAVSLDYPGGPSVITMAFIRERQEGQSEKDIG